MSTVGQEAQKFTKTAIAACLEVINNGWTIVQETYSDKNKKECCAITAIGLSYSEDIWDKDDGQTDLFKIGSVIFKKLGFYINSIDRISFTRGFDRKPPVTTEEKYYFKEDTINPWFNAGYKVAETLRSEGLLGELSE